MFPQFNSPGTMSLTHCIVVLLLHFSCSVANSSPIPKGNLRSDPVRTVFQFPNGTYVENLAVRSNGEILVSVVTSPELFLVNPVQSGQPKLVHNFTGAFGVYGIAEYEPDVFACITGNYNTTTGNVSAAAGSWAVWSVNLRGVESQTDVDTLYLPAHVFKIADVPEARLLNGISLLSRERGTLLVGDLSRGNIIRLDIKSGDYEVVIANDLTATARSPTYGVDGLHVRDGFVFVANFGKYFFGKIPINEDGTPTGNGTIIAHTLAPPDQFDDFTFDRKGNAYLVTGSGNSVERISPDGRRQVIVAGNLNSTEIAEPTSAAFGRGPSDKNVLYVTTGGGLLSRPAGKVVGGQLVAITTDAEGPG